MTSLVAVYYDGNRHRAMAIDASGSNKEVWAAANAAVGDSELIALVEGARGSDAFCLVADGDESAFVTLAEPVDAQPVADSGLTTAQINAKAAAEAEGKAAKTAKKPAAKKTKGA